MAPTASTSTPAGLLLRNVLNNSTQGEQRHTLIVITALLGIDVNLSFTGTFGHVDVINATAEVDDYESDCGSGDGIPLDPPVGATGIGDIPAKEIIIVVLMLALWIYSIILTRKAWYRILKE